MKKILVLMMVVLFASTTIISAQTVPSQPKKKETKTEVKKEKKSEVKKESKSEAAKGNKAAVKDAKASTGTHLKEDGTPDKRYKENKTPVHTEHLKRMVHRINVSKITK